MMMQMTTIMTSKDDTRKRKKRNTKEQDPYQKYLQDIEQDDLAEVPATNSLMETLAKFAKDPASEHVLSGNAPRHQVRARGRTCHHQVDQSVLLKAA